MKTASCLTMHALTLMMILALTPQASAAVDLCEGLVTQKSTDRNNNNFPMTSVSQPAVGEAVIDPEFGTRIIRITDAAAVGRTVIKPAYSTQPSWNADESLIWLYQRGGGHVLYDGTTYEFVGSMNINPADLEQVYWHTSDPDVLFYPQAGSRQLIRYHVSTKVKDVVRDFSDVCTGSVRSESHQYMSWDSNLIGLKCDGQGFIYRISDNTITGRKPGELPNIATSGTKAKIGTTSIVDLQLNQLRTINLAQDEHSSMGRHADGRDVYNVVVFDAAPGGNVGTLISFDLDTGQEQPIISGATGWPYPGSGTHISSHAHKQPGWVAISSCGYSKDGQDLLDSELLLANVDTKMVCRVAHHRSLCRDNPLGYWAEPHVNISPSGTRMLFASDWQTGGPVDTYVLELPSYQPNTIPPSTCPADVNGDGAVNIFDLVVAASNFGATSGPADVNGDGQVNIFDLVVIAGAFGAACP